MTNARHLILVGIATAAVSLGGCGSSSSTPPSDAGLPSVTLTSPSAGAVVALGGGTTVDVVFDVTNFSLEAPPTGCGGKDSDNCGHVHVLIDGTMCNATGMPYNVAYPSAGTATSPATVTADLASCPMATGTHTLVLSLHKNSHAAVSNGASATVMFTAN